MTAISVDEETRVVPRPVSARRLVREQALVVGGQLFAGIGNMVFSLIAAHALPNHPFSQLATFLALYLIVQIPTTGLAAAAAAAPDTAVRMRLVGGVGLLIGLLAIVSSPFLAPALGLPVSMVVLLGLGVPVLALLAAVRGRLYGRQRQGVAVATLVTEPMVRLVVGWSLIPLIGATGAAGGVVLGGYLALALGLLGERRRPSRDQPAGPAAPSSAGRMTILTFTALTLMQNIDVVLANRLLDGPSSGTFAAVSTLGGVSAFATATIPLVLLPRIRPGSEHTGRATGVALTAAGLLGGVIVLVAAAAPASAYGALLGEKYSAIGSIAVPYVAAMGVFGIARVLAARLCTAGQGRLVTAIVWLAVAAQAAVILAVARTPTAVAHSTEAAIALLAIGTAGTQLRQSLVASRSERAERAEQPAGRAWWTPARVDAALLLGFVAVATAIRLTITRGLWVDEATSVKQAEMTYHGMLGNLEHGDVHPPGYFSILWVWVRAFGEGPLAVRMPSVLMGLALIPVVYGAAKDLFDRRTALVAAGLTVLAPQAVWYSQEARMYSMFMLFVVLAVWAQARVLKGGGPWAWLGYAAASTGLLYTQYFTTLVVLAQQAVFLAVLGWRWRRRVLDREFVLMWVMATAIVAIAILPIVGFADVQFSINQALGKGFGAPSQTGTAAVGTASNTTPSTYALIANLVWITVGYHSNALMTDLGAMWPLGMLLALALLGRGRSRSTMLLIVVAFVPVFGMFAAGQLKPFVFDLRYFIGAVPLLLMLAARAAARWPRSHGGFVAMTTVFALVLGAGVWDQQVNGENPRRYDFQPALAQIASVATPRDQVLLSPNFLFDVSQYYERQLRYVNDTGTLQSIAHKLAGAEHVFVLGSFFTTGNERQHLHNLMHVVSAHRHLVHRWAFDNVTVWELS